MNRPLNREEMRNIAARADELIHEAHEALGRMNTRLTLAEAKVALVRDLLLRRRLRERDQAVWGIVPPCA